MSKGDEVYEGLEFKVQAELSSEEAEEREPQELRREVPGCIMNALFSVREIAGQDVTGFDPGTGSGGLWKVEASLTEPLNPEEYTELHSEIKQALSREAEDVSWLRSLRPKWSPSGPPG